MQVTQVNLTKAQKKNFPGHLKRQRVVFGVTSATGNYASCKMCSMTLDKKGDGNHAEII